MACLIDRGIFFLDFFFEESVLRLTMDEVNEFTPKELKNFNLLYDSNGCLNMKLYWKMDHFLFF